MTIKMKNELFWILFMIATMLIAGVALAEFCQWLDTQPELKQELGV